MNWPYFSSLSSIACMSVFRENSSSISSRLSSNFLDRSASGHSTLSWSSMARSRLSSWLSSSWRVSSTLLLSHPNFRHIRKLGSQSTKAANWGYPCGWSSTLGRSVWKWMSCQEMLALRWTSVFLPSSALWSARMWGDRSGAGRPWRKFRTLECGVFSDGSALIRARLQDCRCSTNLGWRPFSTLRHPSFLRHVHCLHGHTRRWWCSR